MAWQIELTATALKQLAKLDKAEARRITDFLRQRLATAEDPRELGKSLMGPKFGVYWRYRVGDYRIICDIQDQRLRIMVVELGHRRDVYR